MRDDRQRLEDILEAIQRIERYSADPDEGSLQTGELIEVWAVHNIQIIGEAARALSPELRDRAPQVSWSRIIGMRHVLVHDYFSIDTGKVWSVVEDELPQLKREVEGLLAEMRD